jgi:hypothetical protein
MVLLPRSFIPFWLTHVNCLSDWGIEVCAICVSLLELPDVPDGNCSYNSMAESLAVGEKVSL